MKYDKRFEALQQAATALRPYPRSMRKSQRPEIPEAEKNPSMKGRELKMKHVAWYRADRAKWGRFDVRTSHYKNPIEEHSCVKEFVKDVIPLSYAVDWLTSKEEKQMIVAVKMIGKARVLVYATHGVRLAVNTSDFGDMGEQPPSVFMSKRVFEMRDSNGTAIMRCSTSLLVKMMRDMMNFREEVQKYREKIKKMFE